MRVDAPGIPATERSFPVPADAQIAAVGDRMVLLDTAANRLVRDDGSTVELPDAAYRLQQTGPARDEVVLATGDSLLFVGVGGGGVREVSADLAAPGRRTRRRLGTGRRRRLCARSVGWGAALPPRV